MKQVVIQPQAVHRLHHGIIDVGSTEICFFTFRTVFHVCLWDPIFSAYLAKKRAEGKHYNVALSHAAKKLVRLIFAMERSRQPYSSAAQSAQFHKLMQASFGMSALLYSFSTVYIFHAFPLILGLTFNS